MGNNIKETLSKKIERDKGILSDFIKQNQKGYSRKKIFQVLGQKYYLSPSRIRDIVYQQITLYELNDTFSEDNTDGEVIVAEKSLVEKDITNRIIRLSGRPTALLDRDIAEFYGTETRRINEQVKRNRKKFPNDFIFQLSDEESKILISQNAISSWGGLPHIQCFLESIITKVQNLSCVEKAAFYNELEAHT